MGRPIYCRRCANGTDVDAGELPDVCPHCHQRADAEDADGALWTTEPPVHGWTLTENDKAWLKKRHISPT